MMIWGHLYRTVQHPPAHIGPANTAVLVFARSTAAELRAERLGDLGLAARRLVNQGLLQQIRRAVAASGLPAIYSTERDQRGETYGERLGNACEAALAEGYEHLVVIGGDCPGLRARHLAEAAQQLASGRGVVGRDLRGGVYLIGLSAKHVTTAAISALPYREPVLAKALCQYLATCYAQGVHELERLGDLHDVADLRREWRSLQARVLSRLAKAFVTFDAELACIVTHVSPPRRVYCLAHAHRGPPRG